MEITCPDLDTIKAVHKKKGLELRTASGLDGTIRNSNGSGTEVVDAMLGTIEQSLAKDQKIADLEKELSSRPTYWAYQQACKAIEHWRKEAKRLGKKAGVVPREMKRK